VKMLA